MRGVDLEHTECGAGRELGGDDLATAVDDRDHARTGPADPKTPLSASR